MATIQVVLDKPLLQAADKRAKRAKQNRSALVRDALREHLRRLEIKEMEAHDRAEFLRLPDTDDPGWEKVQAWPED